MPDTKVLQLWKRAASIPGGKRLFSMAVARKAPYFTSIKPQIEEMRPNFARVSMKKRRAVENHIGTVHAIAACNLLELVMGVCAEATVPAHLRWIPKGMTVEYTAKAETDLYATAETDPNDWKPGELNVKVAAYDANDRVVVKGVIKLWVSEKPKG
jgi:acyl-coenzyme A thioesterase PaaI-like protein